jgi:hypothetical protein
MSLPICPKCNNYIPNNESPGEYPGAMSRRDNKIEICSDCGVQEALEDFARHLETAETRSPDNNF